MRRREFVTTASAAGLTGVFAGCTTVESLDPSSTPTSASTGAAPDSPRPTDSATATPPADASGLPPLDGWEGSTAPDGRTEGQIDREFRQTFDGRETVFTLSVPEALYDYYSRRYRTRAYGSYVSDSYDDQYVQSLADEFRAYGERNDLSEREVVDHAMVFVQNLQYAADEVGTGFDEYPKYPVETLVDRGGDCEDTSVLLSSLLEALGHDTVLLALYDANHMALGVAGSDLSGSYYEFEGRRYYYVETTAPGWRVGELPPEVEDVRAESTETRYSWWRGPSTSPTGRCESRPSSATSATRPPSARPCRWISRPSRASSPGTGRNRSG
jgi:predicted transglutaminase-like cysteine proteinase